MLPTAYDITNKVVLITGTRWGIGMVQRLAAAGADVVLNALMLWVKPIELSQLLIFERDQIASRCLPGPVRLLLHGVEGQDRNPIWPDEQHGLSGLPLQHREITKYHLPWTVDRLVRGPDHGQKTFRGLELGLNLRTG